MQCLSLPTQYILLFVIIKAKVVTMLQCMLLKKFRLWNETNVASKALLREALL